MTCLKKTSLKPHRMAKTMKIRRKRNQPGKTGRIIEGLQEDVILRVTFEVEQDDGEDEV